MCIEHRPSTNEIPNVPVLVESPKPPKGEAEILAFYGDPRTYKDPSLYWKHVGAFAFVDSAAFHHIPLFRRTGGFWCHYKLKPIFEAVFKEIKEKNLSSALKSFDGCYVHRPIRGATRLSLHSFGCAIDINAGECPLGSEKRLPEELIKCFTKRGFFYGGDFKGRKDPMHFEYGSY